MAEQKLFERLAELRSRLKYVLWVHGVCWLVVVFFLTALLAGSLDWLCRLDDSGVRFVLTLAILGCSGYVAWRYLWRPLTVKLTDVDLAARIERRHPEFEDGLSSTVQFLASKQDARTGSPELQREVIRQTLAKLDRVRVDRIIETSPVQRVASGALLTCVLVGLIVGFNRVEAGTAINRLVFPFSDVPWPKKVDLRFVNRDLSPLSELPNGGLTAVRGDTLELFVENLRGPMPDDVTLFVRRSDGAVSKEAMRQSNLWDKDGTRREISGTSLTITKGPIFLWARGGDCETLPVQVDVVPPPVISSFHLKVTPPAYTGQKPRTLSENVGDVQGPVGTKLVLTATSNKALLSAKLHRKGSDPVDMKLTQDGREVSGEFLIHEAGTWTWWLALRDRQDFGNPDAPRYEIRGTPDAIPSVHFEEPNGDLLVTPTARVDFRVVAKDDLALKDVRLVYDAQLGVEFSPRFPEPPDQDEDSGPLDLVKRDAPESVPVAQSRGESSQQGEFILYDATDSPEILTLDFDWNLTPHDFSPGTRIVVIAQATDWYDLGEPHIGQSNPRTLTVVSPEEKRQELAERQAMLLLDLERAEALQTTARGHVEELQLQLDKAGKLRPEDVDLLKRIELDQRQLESRITDKLDGLEARSRAIQAERRSNEVEDPESSALLETLAGELSFLRSEALPEIRQKLTQSIKTAEESSASPKTSPDTKRELDSAAVQQDTVLKTLRGVLGKLSKWRNQRNLSGDLRDLEGDQGKLADETADTGKLLATKTASEFTKQDEVDLARLSTRQQQIADQLEDFGEQLKSAANDLRDEDPEQADAIDRATRELEKSQLTSEMRQASAALMQKRIGDASRAQQKAVEELRKLRDVLEQRDVTGAENFVKRLGEAGQELAGLKNELHEVLRKLEDANGISNDEQRERELEKLRKEQEQVKQKIDEMERRLQRLRSNADRPVGRAAQRLERADQSLSSGDGEAAQEQLQEALDDLEQAQRELAEDQREAEESLAQELMEKIGDQLKSLQSRQKAAIEETLRLRSEYENRGSWTRTLLKSLRNLATVQQALEAETLSAAEQVQAVEILALALRGAARSMKLATESLGERSVGEQTVQWQKQAATRFDDLLKALETVPNEEGQPPPGQGEPQNETGPPGERVALLSQLKIVRALQADLISRFEQVRQKEAEAGNLTDNQKKELAAIAEEQSQLADLIRELTSFFGEPEESDAPPADAEENPVAPQQD
ncbi:MAG: hypothetical protein O2820_00945 [Planctomycetota bacterium]|nr:hypothetical protein [Planctomycetota bacterium]MDA1247763.1 hypothetical protein [Planctomycetota bacterium]